MNFDLDDLAKMRRLIRLSERLGDEHLPSKLHQEYAAKVREITEHFEDLACSHTWRPIFKPLQNGDQMYECEGCKSRRVMTPEQPANSGFNEG